MIGNKKQVFYRKTSIIGNNLQHIPYENKLTIFTNCINNVLLSRAFDQIFNVQTTKSTLIELNHNKVDTNLLNHLLKHNTSNLSDIRSRSQLNRVQKSIYSRSRTPLKKKKKKSDIVKNPFKENNNDYGDDDQVNLFKSQNFEFGNNLKKKLHDDKSVTNFSIFLPNPNSIFNISSIKI